VRTVRPAETTSAVPLAMTYIASPGSPSLTTVVPSLTSTRAAQRASRSIVTGRRWAKIGVRRRAASSSVGTIAVRSTRINRVRAISDAPQTTKPAPTSAARTPNCVISNAAQIEPTEMARARSAS
jgi:hypothetical protein